MWYVAALCIFMVVSNTVCFSDSICYEVMNEWSLFTLPPLEPGASAIKCDGLNAQCHPIPPAMAVTRGVNMLAIRHALAS